MKTTTDPQKSIAETLMTTPENALEIKGVSKTFQGKRRTVEALKNVSLTIPRGCIFGLLGPNGAGKSTLINVMAGLVIKDTGSVNLWGIDLDHYPKQSRAAIGVVPQELNMDAFLTPRQLLDAQGGLYGVPKSERQTMQLLRDMRLEDKADAFARTLSGGMKRRLMVAKAMVHAPPILVLDEPTAGVDVELRQELWQFVKALNDQGVTILLTTHYLEEAEALCDHIAIINHGEVIANEPTHTLVRRLDRKELTVTFNQPIQDMMAALPESLKPFYPEQLCEKTLKMHYRPSKAQMSEILEALTATGLTIQDLTTQDADLEDVFLALTRRQKTDGARIA